MLDFFSRKLQTPWELISLIGLTTGSRRLAKVVLIRAPKVFDCLEEIVEPRECWPKEGLAIFPRPAGCQRSSWPRTATEGQPEERAAELEKDWRPREQQ